MFWCMDWLDGKNLRKSSRFPFLMDIYLCTCHRSLHGCSRAGSVVREMLPHLWAVQTSTPQTRLDRDLEFGDPLEANIIEVWRYLEMSLIESHVTLHHS